jgi:hypothetical protein
MEKFMTKFWLILMTSITAATIAVSPSASAATGSFIEKLQGSINASLLAHNRPQVNWRNAHSGKEGDMATDNSDIYTAGMIIDDETEQTARDYPVDTLANLGITAGLFVQWVLFGVDFDNSSMPAQKQRFCYSGVVAKDYLEANHRGLTDDERVTFSDFTVEGMSAADNAQLSKARLVGMSLGDMQACDVMLLLP